LALDGSGEPFGMCVSGKIVFANNKPGENFEVSSVSLGDKALDKFLLT